MPNTSLLAEHAFPGNLTDMTSDADKQAWSNSYISAWMAGEIAGGGQGPNGIVRTPLSQFFDGDVTPYDQTQSPTPVTWKAFPKRVQTWLSNAEPLRWQIADSSRIYQDEYLEWSVFRTGKDPMDYSGNILSCSFTCEGPEYWQFLATQHPEAILPLYKKLNPVQGNNMSNADLFLNGNFGSYNPTNYWNFLTSTGSIAHLIHPSNTLGAEIDIAAQATVIRQDSGGKVINDPTQLINCSQYGNQYRNSDPKIGFDINTLAQHQNSITVAEPVALYMYSFDTSNFKLDQTGLQDTTKADLVDVPAGIFNFTRGDITIHQGLRLDISVPSTMIGTKSQKPLTVSDIFDTSGDGNYIKCAAQFADYVLMSVSADVINPVTVASAQNCPGASQMKPHSSELLAAHGVKAGVTPRFALRRAA